MGYICALLLFFFHDKIPHNRYYIMFVYDVNFRKKSMYGTRQRDHSDKEKY